MCFSSSRALGLLGFLQRDLGDLFALDRVVALRSVGGCGGSGGLGGSGGGSTGFGGAGFGLRRARGFGAADGPISSASIIGPGNADRRSGLRPQQTR